MHKGGRVKIHMAVSPVPFRRYTDEGATAVTVGGHAAMYRRLVGERETIEEWLVDIDEMFVEVTVRSETGTSQADLDEAYAIVNSIRNEPAEAGAFRLAFTLTTNKWSSG
jgi:hypothetical protein